VQHAVVACTETHEPGASPGVVALGDGEGLVTVLVTDERGVAVTMVVAGAVVVTAAGRVETADGGVAEGWRLAGKMAGSTVPDGREAA
jgi:hypothetical protein